MWRDDHSVMNGSRMGLYILLIALIAVVCLLPWVLDHGGQ
jgi:hypothetical protein